MKVLLTALVIALGYALLFSMADASMSGPVEGQELIPFAFTESPSPKYAGAAFTARGKSCSMSFSAGGIMFGWKDSGESAAPQKALKKKLSGTFASPADRKSFCMALEFIGANPKVCISGKERLPWNTAFFIGNDPSRWRVDVPNYRSIRAEQVYEGIDIVYSGGNTGIKYDLICAPGKDPESVFLRYVSDDSRDISLTVTPSGDLEISTPFGSLTEQKPSCYQIIGGKRIEVAARFLLSENAPGTFSFELGAYDPRNELVIDPELVYSTFIGGQGVDIVNDMAVGIDGKAYLTGYTSVSSSWKPAEPMATFEDSLTAFVVKMNAGGTEPEYIAFIGGLSRDSGMAIAPDTHMLPDTPPHTTSP